MQREERGRNVGIDLSQGMLSRARSSLIKAGCGNHELGVGGAFEIRDHDGSFDLVLNSYMSYVPEERDWPRALGEFRRVLRPGERSVLANMTFGEGTGTGIHERIHRWLPGSPGVVAVSDRLRFPAA